MTVARSAAPARALPSAPDPVRARWDGAAARISWGTSAGATGYAVVADLSDGQRSLTRLPAAARSATLAGLHPDETGTIKVAGMLADGTPGPFATVALRRRRTAR